MASLEEIRQIHLGKLAELKKVGLDPYPIESHQDFTLAEVINNFTKLSKKKSLTIAGRVMALRPQGALTFLNLNDGTENFQALIKKPARLNDISRSGGFKGISTKHFFPLYHPAAALYNGGLRETLMDDFKKIPLILKKINNEK